ncbi:MAG: murein biosynthesis integral membrane protein MurJ [Planctomycetes bacterium]|nr:murein biosynthesis integral membrane protein MurJ [Planctomycetota bacterium]
MFKGFRQIAFLTVISRVFGMVRDMVFSHFFGLSGMMDIWAIAFMIPNLSRRIFGEGAAASSLIPVYSEALKKDKAYSLDLARTVVTVIFVMLAVIVIAGEIGIWLYCKNYDPIPNTRRMLLLVAIMLPYMCLICTVAILAGLLNSHRHFAMPAAAPIVLNLIIISVLCISGWGFKIVPEKQVFLLAVGVLFAGMVQLVMQIVPLTRHGIVLRPAWHVQTEAFRKIMFLMGPMILGLTVTQLNTLADGVIAKWLSASDQKGETLLWLGREVAYPARQGAVASLYFAQRLYQFPLGVLGISLATAIFPILSAAAADKDENLLRQTIQRGFAAAIFVALPATIGLFLVSRPLTAILYQHGQFGHEDTRQVQMVLIFYSLGLCAYFLQQLVIRAFYSMKDSKWPARTAMIAVAVNIVLNLTLIWPLGVSGLALSTAICSYLQVLILLAILSRKFKFTISKNVLSLSAKTIVATAVMAGAGWGTQKLMSGLASHKTGDLLQVVTLVAVCSGVYIIVSRRLGNPMLSLLFGARKKPKITLKAP